VLITFFNKHCVISREFVPEGQTWNIEFWLYVLGMLLTFWHLSFTFKF
jgi:hypothetical protein